MGQAAPVIIAVAAAVAIPVAGEFIGEAILAEIGTTAAESGIAAETVGASAIGGTSSAVNAAIQGKDLEGVLTAGAEGAASAFAGAEIGQAVAGVPEQAGPFVDASGNVIPGPSSGVAGLTDSAKAAKVAGSAAGGATGGFTRAELGGSNLQSALRQGGISGLSSAAGSLLFPTDSTSDTSDKVASSVGKTLLGQQVASMLAPTATTSSRGGTTQTVGAGGSSARGAVSGPSGYGDTITGGGASPGSQALSQVLNLGSPTSAYSDTGAGGEKTSPETGGKPQNVWNLASLRVKDATGGEA